MVGMEDIQESISPVSGLGKSRFYKELLILSPLSFVIDLFHCPLLFAMHV